MKETKVICPNCGAEIAIAKNEHTVKNATVIGKDSNLGTVALPLAKKGKADERLEALKKAGVDTSNLFAMRGASGDGFLVRMQDGKPTFVEDDDPIFNSIKEGGFIPARELFRRWVTSQMFGLLTCENWRTHKPMSFNEALSRKGYEYQWKMLVEEMRVQSILFNKDSDNFIERNRWFNRDKIVDICEEYIVTLHNYIAGLTERKCKGVPYKKIGTRNIFVSDIEAKVFRPLYERIQDIKRTPVVSPQKLYFALKYFDNMRVRMSYKTKQEKSWVDAYKGAGAFYTMKNLIMFHGCRYYPEKYGLPYDLEESLKKLTSRSIEYRNEGWRMLAMMKKLIADNHLDIEAKKKEWRDRKTSKN